MKPMVLESDIRKHNRKVKDDAIARRARMGQTCGYISQQEGVNATRIHAVCDARGITISTETP